jgi:hypothetical protein
MRLLTYYCASLTVECQDRSVRVYDRNDVLREVVTCSGIGVVLSVCGLKSLKTRLDLLQIPCRGRSGKRKRVVFLQYNGVAVG